MFWSQARFTHWGGEGNCSGWHLQQKTWETVCHFAIQGVKILLWVEGKESDLFNSALAGHLFLMCTNTACLGWEVYLIKKRATTNVAQSIYSVDSVLSNFYCSSPFECNLCV